VRREFYQPLSSWYPTDPVTGVDVGKFWVKGTALEPRGDSWFCDFPGFLNLTPLNDPDEEGDSFDNPPDNQQLIRFDEWPTEWDRLPEKGILIDTPEARDAIERKAWPAQYAKRKAIWKKKKTNEDGEKEKSTRNRRKRSREESEERGRSKVRREEGDD
jgi:hypothetical protein